MEYMGAAIVQEAPGGADKSHRVAFWKKGNFLAIDPYCYADGACIDIDIEDIVWDSNGSCSVLTAQETVHVWKIEESEGELRFIRRVFYMKAGEARYREENITARYLVHSRGDLLMIVRYSDTKRLSTTGFRVFKKLLQFEDTGCELTCFKWTELHTLEGRLIFVARACSRCYEASHYPGQHEGIYFLDDRSAFSVESGRQFFFCSDTGRWSGLPPVVDKNWFHPGMTVSTYSSPGWLLP
jgi:hypothetical protein